MSKAMTIPTYFTQTETTKVTKDKVFKTFKVLKGFKKNLLKSQTNNKKVNFKRLCAYYLL